MVVLGDGQPANNIAVLGLAAAILSRVPFSGSAGVARVLGSLFHHRGTLRRRALGRLTAVFTTCKGEDHDCANKAQARDFSFKVGFCPLKCSFILLFFPVGYIADNIASGIDAYRGSAAQNGSRTNRANDDGNIQGQPNNGCMGVDAAGLGG